MNKICTSIEQSKKLIELGLDVKTADMNYSTFYGAVSKSLPMPKEVYEYFKYPIDGDKYVPAWSLSALLGLMPKLYEFESDPEDGGCQPNVCKGWDNNQWHIVYRSSIYITEWYDSPLDAAFEMVCCLKENGKI